MKKVKALAAVMILAAAMVSMLPSKQAQAASVSASFEKVSPDTDIRVEDMLKLRLSLSADVELGAVELYISYNSNVFEYVTGPDCVFGGEGVLKISDSGTSTYSTKRDYLLYFQAAGMGDGKFSLGNNPEIYDADEDMPMSVSSQPLTLSVFAGTTASSDATLAELKVGSAVLSPSFDPQIKDYTVHVENSVTKLAVSAIANDPVASVRVEGADDLKVGNNRITVVVSAPDGTEIKYVIYCIRDEASEEENAAAEEDGAEKDDEPKAEPTADTGHAQAFYVTQKDDKIILVADTQYQMMETEGTVKVPDGYYKTSILISGYTITAFSPVPDGTPEYLLLILCKEGSEPGLYVYDRIEKTIQRYGLTSGGAPAETGAEKEVTDEKLPDPEAYEKSISTLTTVIAVLSGVCMLLLIIVIRLIFRNRGTSGKRGTGGTRKRATRGKKNDM